MTSLGLSIPREVSLRQQVIDGLRDSILYGALEPGQKLIERELCEELRISRTVLREALQHLDAEGLIVNTPRRGRTVVEIGKEEAREIYEVRQALETVVGEGFARNATDAEIARLRAHFDQMYAAGPVKNMLIAENEFFSIILENCGNRVAAEFFKQLNNRVTILRRLSVFQGRRSGEKLAELGEIVAAIEARDIKRTGELCAKRVAKAAEAASRLFSEAAVAAG